MRLRRETGMSLVLVTHDLAVVEETSDRTAIVYAGVTVETGPTEAVIGDPTHPYTKALLSARPASVLYGEPLVGIPGTPPAVGEFPKGAGSRRAADSAGRRAKRRRLRSRPSPPSRRVHAFAGRRRRVSQPILTASEAGVRYPGAATPALENATMDVHAGTSVGIVGESGSGKTTFGRVLVGLLHPQLRASVLVDGRAWKRSAAPIRSAETCR